MRLIGPKKIDEEDNKSIISISDYLKIFKMFNQKAMSSIKYK